MALLSSTNYVALKVLGEGRSEAVVAAVRFSGAVVPFLPLLPKYLNWTSMKGGIEIGLWCALGYVAQAVGLQTADASHGAFICSLSMVVVPVFQSMRGERISGQLWCAVSLAIFGTALLIGVLDGEAAAVSVGDIVCGGAAVAWGITLARTESYAGQKGFDPIGCTLWQTVAIALVMAMWMVATLGPAQSAIEVTHLVSSGPEVLLALFWISIVTTAGILFVETWAMEEVDSTEAGVIFATQPVGAALFASMVLGESFGSRDATGAALILAACLLTQVKFEFGRAQGEALPEASTN